MMCVGCADISATGLKKIMFFQPDTYVKFKIGPVMSSDPAMNSSWPPSDGGATTESVGGNPLFSTHRGGGFFTPPTFKGNATTLPHLPNQGQVTAKV